MQGVSVRFRRSLGLALLFSVVFAHGAAAAGREDWSGRLFDKFSRAKQFIITAYSRLGTPPG
jgi:hypothetical protein